MTPRKVWILGLAASSLAFVAFIPALSADFVNWDDDWNFVQNPDYRGLGPAQLKWMFTDTYGHYMPVTWLTLGLDYVLYGMNPAGYHFTSVLLHAANALVFFFVVLRLLGNPWAAFAAALFFAVHPLRAESVAWVTERRDVVSGLFFMLSILTYLKAQENRKWLWVSVACFAVSLLSKAMGMMLPVVLLVIDYYVLKRKALAEKIPYVVLLVVSIAATKVLQGNAGALYTTAQYPPADMLLQPWSRMTFYVWKTVVPFGLSPLYPYRSLSLGFEWKHVVALVAVLASVGGLWAARRKYPQLGLAAFCYLALLSPTVVWQAGPHLVADRYSYLACLPFAVLFGGWVAVRGRAVSAVVLAGLMILTWRQATIWHDSVTLWTRAIDLGTTSSLPYVSRGVARAEKGDLDGAVADFQAALKIDPKEVKANDNMSRASLMKGDAVAAEAYANAAIDRDPSNAKSWFSRALARAERRQYAAAAEDFTKALDLAARERKPTVKAIDALANRGLARLKAGQFAEAEDDATRAMAADPTAPRPALLRATARTLKRDLDGALGDFALVRKLDAAQPSPYVARGVVRMDNGDAQGALTDFSEAIRLEAGHPLAYVRRGRLKAKQRDLGGAIADTTEALRIDPRNVEALAVRGAARGDQGDLAGAVEDFDLALRVAPPGWGERKTVEAFLDQARKMLKR